MNDENKLGSPPNVNELLTIQTDLSKLNSGTSDILYENLNFEGSVPCSSSITETTAKARKILDNCIKTIAKIKTLHDAFNNYIQSLEKESDILNNAKMIYLKLSNTLKKAKKLEKIYRKALNSIVKAEKCKTNEKPEDTSKEPEDTSEEMEENTAEDYLYEAKGRYHHAQTIIEQHIQKTINSVCSLLKTILRVLNFTPLYNSATPQKIFVLMIANSTFSDDKILEGIQTDVTIMQEFVESKSDIFELELHVNQTKEETDGIIQKLRSKDLSKYSSILLIFDSHGEKDNVCTTDRNKLIPTCELWQWCTDNPSICEQPVVIIIETCRGNQDEICAGVNSKAARIESHPNMPNILVIYAAAYGYTAKCEDNKGSEFLVNLLDVLKADKFKDWDILAQITEASKFVLKRVESSPSKLKHTHTQTVNYMSLLPCQLKLNRSAIHDWKDVQSYDLVKHHKMRALFFTHPNLKTQAENLSDVMKNLNIEVPDGILECSKFNPEIEVKNNNTLNILFIVVMGLASCDEIHKELLPSIRKKLSHQPCAALNALNGRPKVILFLGPLESHNDAGKCVSLLTTETSTEEGSRSKATGVINIASENSDFLAYCDSAPGWLETTKQILTAAPGNDEGLVRLLTTRGMARRPALLSDSPPHIESSLRYKLVLPKTEQDSQQLKKM